MTINLQRLYDRRDELHIRRRRAVKLAERIQERRRKPIKGEDNSIATIPLGYADTLQIDNELIIINEWIKEAIENRRV